MHCSTGDAALRRYGSAAPWAVKVLALVVILPLLGAVGAAATTAWDASAWQALAQDPQWPNALVTTLGVGLAGALLAAGLSAYLLAGHFPGPGWSRLLRNIPAMLAMPHAAFAIGWVMLVAPSGWLLRALSPWLTGFDVPPLWATSQDPYGIGLVAVLVFKEVPFLIWTSATQLQRPDFAHALQQSLLVAQTLGYSPRAAWWRVVAPQLADKMRWPFLAVLAYNLTGVDMALVAGPTTPPTLAVLALNWLQDADPVANAKGAAAAWLLGGLLALVAIFFLFLRLPRAWHTRGCTRPIGPISSEAALNRRVRKRRSHLLLLWVVAYWTIGLAIVLASCAGPWPFPAFWPAQWSTQAWRSVGDSSGTLWLTLALGGASGLSALVWCIAWLEWAPPLWRQRLERLVFIPLVMPGLLWAMGLHQLALGLQLDASLPGVYLAHTLSVLPYVLIALAPAYTHFDPRYAQLAASLHQPYRVFLLRVKWPMLKTAISGALAVGFAVSVAQYLPTLFVGAGRWSTVTTEALSLSAGGQRNVLAAFAVLQAALPMMAFFWAQRWAQRPPAALTH